MRTNHIGHLPEENAGNNKFTGETCDTENVIQAKPDKSKNPLSKWFSSLTRKNKSKLTQRPMIEILFDQEFSRDDSQLDRTGHNEYLPPLTRKMSDPSDRGKQLSLRYGSLDRQPWTRENARTGVSTRLYGSLDRRAQSQILPRGIGTAAQLGQRTLGQNHNHSSSSGSEANLLNHRQHLLRPLDSTPNASSRNPLDSILLLQVPRKTYLSDDADASQPDLKQEESLFQWNSEPKKSASSVDWSLPRNFRLAKNLSEGTINVMKSFIDHLRFLVLF